MQGLLEGPRAGLSEAEVIATLKMDYGPVIRHGCQVLNHQDKPTGDPDIRFTDGRIGWSYRPHDRVTNRTTSVAEVRRTAELTLPDQLYLHVNSMRFKIYTEIKSPSGIWIPFERGVFVANNPGIKDDGVLITRRLLLADKTHLYKDKTLGSPVFIEEGVNPVQRVVSVLQETFGETNISIPPTNKIVTEGILFPGDTSYLEFFNRLLEVAAYDQLTCGPSGVIRADTHESIANRGFSAEYGPGKGFIKTAGEVEPLLPSLPNVVRFTASRGPSLPEEGNGIETRRNESTGPASIDARSNFSTVPAERARAEIILEVEVEADSAAELKKIADSDAQRYFAGGGFRYQGEIVLNPLLDDRDVFRLLKPRMDLSGNWIVTEWSSSLGRIDSESAPLMSVTLEKWVGVEADPPPPVVDPEPPPQNLYEAHIAGILSGPQQRGTLPSPITEPSGLAASRRHSAVWYTHNDWTHPNEAFMFNMANGERLATLTLGGAGSIDYEDVAIGRGPNPALWYVYIYDTHQPGSSGTSATHTIYRFPEPDTVGDQTVQAEALTITYPSPRYVESFAIDPITGDGFGLRMTPSNPAEIWRFPAITSALGGSTTAMVNTGQALSLQTQPQQAQHTHEMVTGLDISRNGDCIILCTYAAVYIYDRPEGTTIDQALMGTPRRIPHSLVQSEGIGFKSNSTGMILTSEGGNNQRQLLHWDIVGADPDPDPDPDPPPPGVTVQNFESGTNGGAIPGSLPPFDAVQGSPTFSSDAALHGNMGAVYGPAFMNHIINVAGLPRVRLSAYIRRPNNPTGHHWVFSTHDGSDNFITNTQIRNETGHAIHHRLGFNSVGQSPSFPVNTWWRIEHDYESGVGVTVRIWRTDIESSGPPDDEFFAPFTSPAATIRFGNTNANSGLGLHVDSMSRSAGEPLPPFGEGGGGDPPSPDGPIAYQNFDSGTHNAEIPAGLPPFTGRSAIAPTYSTEAAAHGSLGAVYGPEAKYHEISVSGRPRTRIRAYIRRPTNTPTFHHFLFACFNASNTLMADTQVRNTTGYPIQHRVNYASVGQTPAFPTNTWWRVEYDHVAGTGVTFRVWRVNPESTGSPDDELFIPLTGAVAVIRFGNANVNSGIPMQFDSMAVSDGQAIGPRSGDPS